MVSKAWVRSERGERIDQPDFEQAAERGPNNAVSQILSELVWSTDGAGAILYGFQLTNPTFGSPIMTVTRGAAIAGYRDRGQAILGAIISGGEASKTIDISSFPNGTYGCYIRLEFRDADFQNRIFWDQNATPEPTEVPRAVPTRRSEDWSVAFEIVSPGTDWIQIASFTLTGGAPGSITDLRRFMFEPRADNGQLFTDTDFGAGLDRDPTRNVNGVRSLSKWVRAVGRQIQDIIGTQSWAYNPQGGGASGTGPRSLTQLNSEKLNRTGLQTFAGVLGPDADQTRDLAASGVRWRDLFCRDVNAARNLIAATQVTAPEAEFATEVRSPRFEFLAPTSIYRTFVGASGHGTGAGSAAFSTDQNASLIKGGSGAWALILPFTGLPAGATFSTVTVAYAVTFTAANAIEMRVRRKNYYNAVQDLDSTPPNSISIDSAGATVDLDLNQNLVVDASFTYFVYITETGAGTLDAAFTLFNARVLLSNTILVP